MTKTFFCALCDESVVHEARYDDVQEGIAAATEHFRLMHPDVYAEMQKWPDGAPVVVDESLTPEEFATDGDSGD